MSIKRLKDFPDGSGSLSDDDIFLFMDDPSGSATTKKISLSYITNGLVQSNTDNITGASGVNNIVSISQANYDNIISPDPNTLYFIV